MPASPEQGSVSPQAMQMSLQQPQMPPTPAFSQSLQLVQGNIAPSQMQVLSTSSPTSKASGAAFGMSAGAGSPTSLAQPMGMHMPQHPPPVHAPKLPEGGGQVRMAPSQGFSTEASLSPSAAPRSSSGEEDLRISATPPPPMHAPQVGVRSSEPEPSRPPGAFPREHGADAPGAARQEKHFASGCMRLSVCCSLCPCYYVSLCVTVSPSGSKSGYDPGHQKASRRQRWVENVVEKAVEREMLRRHLVFRQERASALDPRAPGFGQLQLPPGLQLPGAPGGARPFLPPPPGGLQLPPGLGGLPGLPGLPPGLGHPPMPKLGMPPPGSLDSEALAQMRFQQVATEYEQIKSAGIDPQVAELAEYHSLDERATRALDEEMKKRRDTFESDLQALWVGLEGAKNPSGDGMRMLMMKLKDMRMGTFKGMTALDKKIHDFAKRNRLDAQAAVKLAEARFR
eukprot:g19848.t1